MSPPLDVYWIWHVHMLNPTGYAEDMQRIVGDPCDHHEFSASRVKERQAILYTKGKWGKKISVSLSNSWPGHNINTDSVTGAVLNMQFRKIESTYFAPTQAKIYFISSVTGKSRQNTGLPS